MHIIYLKFDILSYHTLLKTLLISLIFFISVRLSIRYSIWLSEEENKKEIVEGGAWSLNFNNKNCGTLISELIMVLVFIFISASALITTNAS